MGSLILNISNRLLIKNINSVAKKNGAFQQCRCFSFKHVFSHRSSTYIFHHYKKSDFSRITPLRFASSMNVIETKPKVESSYTNLSQTNQNDPSYSIEDSSDLKFIIVKDKGKGGEEISNFSPETLTVDSALPPIPEPPTPVTEVVTDAAAKTIDPEVLAKLLESGVEPPLADLGLGFCWYYPPSYIRAVLEYLHVTWDLPWWGSIVLTTFVLRVLTVPIYVKSRRYMVEFSNTAPKMQLLQYEHRAAIMAGDNMRAATLSHDMMRTFKDMHFGKAMFPMLIQGITFLPFFWALRSMANLPVESMKHGGMLWFTDLTLPDQFYILPITTSATLGLMFWLGTDSVKIRDVQSNIAKGGMIAMPLIVGGVATNFPAAVLCYWTTTNFFSLGQSLVLRIPALQEYFNIPKPVAHKKLDASSLGFIQNMKETYRTSKIFQEVKHREELNQKRFQLAGREPIVRTFKKNPLLAQAKPK